MTVDTGHVVNPQRAIAISTVLTVIGLRAFDSFYRRRGHTPCSARAHASDRGVRWPRACQGRGGYSHAVLVAVWLRRSLAMQASITIPINELTGPSASADVELVSAATLPARTLPNSGPAMSTMWSTALSRPRNEASTVL